MGEEVFSGRLFCSEREVKCHSERGPSGTAAVIVIQRREGDALLGVVT